MSKKISAEIRHQVLLLLRQGARAQSIAAVTVDHSSKEVSHFRCCPPVVVVRMCGHVVAVENHDGKARELQQAIF